MARMKNSGGMNATTVSQQVVQAFQDDGVVALPGLVDAEWVERLRSAMEEVLAAPGPTAIEFAKNNAPRFFGETFAWLYHPVFREIACESHLPKIAARMMGANEVSLAWDHLFVKEPHAPGETPWHQDLPYVWLDGMQNISFWIALDEVTPGSGAVEFVKGSHLWGKWYQPESFDPQRDYDSGEWEKMPDINGHRDDYDLVQPSLRPGDAVAFHLLTIHHAPGNTSDRRRRGLSIRYAGDDATYAVREKGPKLPRDPGLAPGDRLIGDLFPRVWPAGAAPR